MKATAVIKRPSEVKGVVGSPLSITANVSKLGGASVIVDPELDPTSENPVENKAITEAIEEVRDSIDALDEAVHDLDDDKQDVLTFDSVPTVNSQNPVTSGGVYSGLQYVMGELADNVNALSESIGGKTDLFVVNATPTSGNYYNLDQPIGTIRTAIESGKYVVIKTVNDTFPYNTTVFYMEMRVLVFGGCVFTEGNLLVRGIAVMPNGVGMAVNLSTTVANSVNGQTGAVSLDATDVGALPDTTVIPTATSQLTNDSGYITSSGAPVQSVNGATGNVTVTVPTKTSDLTNDNGFVNASGAASAAPVQSVNGQTGAVSLSIPTVPSNVSAFTNDAGYVTASTAPVRSVNGQTGVVTLSIPTVPSNVSAFTNDAGYLTLSTLPIYSGGVSP